MPEYLRALVVILFLAATVFAIGQTSACATAIAVEDFRRRRNLWVAITLFAFLIHDFWLFTGVAAVVLFLVGRRDPNPLALFLFLVFAVPAISSEISGFGLAHQLFALSYPRLLSLTVLLPAAFTLLLDPERERPGFTWPDRILAVYIALNLLLQLNVDTFTNTLRYGLYHLMDTVLPYYVASRSLRSLRQLRDTLMSFGVAALVLSAIGTFEFLKSWLLYSSLDSLMQADWAYGAYLARGDSLRALASTGQPIALGFVIAVACGVFLYLQRVVPNRNVWLLGFGLLLAGLVAPLSRGPWLGTALGFITFLATGPKPLESILKLALAGLIAGPLVLASPLGDTILDHLPFIGSIEADTVLYRQQLLEMSLDVIRRNPLFGSYDFLWYLEDMRQGQGIIDIVNTYLGVALASGLVGLGLFASFFFAIGRGLFQTLRADGGDEEIHLLARVLFAILVAILAIIFTVSSITVIPIIYWSMAGIGHACIRLAEKARAPRASSLPLTPPRVVGVKA